MRPRINALDPDLLKAAFWIFIVVSVIGIGLAILERVRRSTIALDDEPEDLLADLEDAVEIGEMEEAELQRVREVLDKRAQSETNGTEPKISRF